MRFTVAVLMLGAVACGSAEEVTAFYLAMPWQSPIEPCPGKDDIGQGLTAILEIGGHDPCELNTNKTNLKVYGTCPNVTVGIVRPLGLGYWLPEPVTGVLVPLAYLVSWVDLRKEALEAGMQTVTVSLAIDSPTSTFLYQDNDINLLPQPDDQNEETDPAKHNTFMARQWARCQLQGRTYAAKCSGSSRLITFERDAEPDGDPNLWEACNGTLWQ